MSGSGGRAGVQITFLLNGNVVNVTDDPSRRLIDVLRERFNLTGVKEGCGEGSCGSCTVLVDGRPRRACATKLGAVDRKDVLTIEGLASEGHPHILQTAFVESGAIQCGYCTPGVILAAKALLDVTPVPTRQQIRSALKHNVCRCTGYKKIIEAVELAARRMHQSDSGELREIQAPEEDTQEKAGGWVGRDAPQEGVWDKATGRARYAADIRIPDCLHLRVVRSSKHHARILSIDSSKALRSPGVIAVLTAGDINGTNRTGPFQRDKPVLADEKVRFVGDAVALVAGETLSAARAGADLVEIAYEDLQALTTPDESLSSGAIGIHASGNLLAEWHVEKGDGACASRNDPVFAEGTFHTGFQEHAYLETEAGVAWTEDDRVVVCLSTQNPHEDREQVAEAIGLRENDIRVIQAPTGGAFGGKTSYDVAALLALAAHKLRRPVKLVYDRSESLLCTEKRHPFRMIVKLSADAAGHLSALEADLTADTGAYASYGKGVAERAATHVSGPYQIPNVRIQSRSVYTNNVPSGAMRGYGAPQVSFAIESLMDILADRLGIDPLEIRRRNIFRVGSVTATGQTLLSSVGAPATIDAIEPYYREATRWADEQPSLRARRGVGLASIFFGISESGRRTNSRISLAITPDGFVELLAGAPDIGQGVQTVLKQIVADELQVPLSAIAVITPDTDVMPSAGATEASRQTFVSGKAAQNAAIQMKQRLASLDLGSTDPTDWREHLRRAHAALVGDGQSVQEVGYCEPPNEPIDKLGRGAPHVTYSFASHLAQVEVNRTTGEVKVVRLVAAHDVGRPINPRALEGQIEGGLIMGLGMGLNEEFLPGATRRFSDYRLPRATDVPEIVNIILNEECPEGPFGAKGVGEVPTVGPAAAIANAVARATGIRPYRLPVGHQPASS